MTLIRLIVFASLALPGLGQSDEAAQARHIVPRNATVAKMPLAFLKKEPAATPWFLAQAAAAPPGQQGPGF